MHPRYLWCVAPKQDAAPSRARRGRWGGGFVCAHARRALARALGPPPALRRVPLRALRVRVPVFLLGVEGGVHLVCTPSPGH